jgi:hypothetical protein
MANRSKYERIQIVNFIIRTIANRGRNFFLSKENGHVAYFVHNGRTLWFIDQYTGVPIKMVKGHQSNDYHFSGGGTMWGLVNDFKDFINGDDDSNHNNGYGGLYCPHWGYPPEDMEAIRAFAIEVGYLKARG